MECDDAELREGPDPKRFKSIGHARDDCDYDMMNPGRFSDGLCDDARGDHELRPVKTTFRPTLPSIRTSAFSRWDDAPSPHAHAGLQARLHSMSAPLRVHAFQRDVFTISTVCSSTWRCGPRRFAGIKSSSRQNSTICGRCAAHAVSPVRRLRKL